MSSTLPDNLDQDFRSLASAVDKICDKYRCHFYGTFTSPKTGESVPIQSAGSFSDGDITTSSSSFNSTASGASGEEESHKMFSVDPSNAIEVSNYLFNCFEEFQQLPCKSLAKSWIKIVEPKKQAKYPYKLRDKSKPYWWPSDARHVEPDHLRKEERISLLISLLRVFKNREAELLNAAGLINELSPKNSITRTGDDHGARRFSILQNMFRVIKNSIEDNVKSIEVIKPGKKYSSGLYRRALLKKRLDQLKTNPTHNQELSQANNILNSNCGKQLLPPLQFSTQVPIQAKFPSYSCSFASLS